MKLQAGYIDLLDLIPLGIVGLMLMLLALVLISAKGQAVLCKPYESLTIDKVPAKCVDYFSPSQPYTVPIYMPIYTGR